MASEKRNVNHLKTTKVRFASEKKVSGSNPETSTQFRHQERSKGALDVQNRFEHLENELLLEDGYNLAQTGRKEVKLRTKVAKDSFRTPNQENHLVDSDEDGGPEQQINTKQGTGCKVLETAICESEGDNGAENEWEDWVDDTELQCYSLFDSKALSSIDSCIEYMKSEYSFDLLGFLKEIDADFYKTVSFVNYTRSKTADKSCFNCGEIFEKDKQLQNHLKLSRHCTTTPSSNLISTMSTIEHLAPFLENDCLFGISMAFDSENEQHH
ncbi:putative protein arginine N-methyltransferase 3 [Zancudomyces culisetae]|uniref:C2H2-type domain-containing protein n=1 Tax=Zancudomyces culisetae TaxID=1213189 RepID=A0A1R1PH82_ZANCU|nr:putative protein arginine N-methyltransferase 3 [Zancudomyces culisetae]|eukprot:OMH80297.1 putative protein arginine N-methyltransferase 3 [Zancudomyces culisetae]